MSFYSFVVYTVLPAVLLFSWMLWEIIESAVHGLVCCSAPTSSCLVKYCITETPDVSCWLRLPHNSETLTLIEYLSRDHIFFGSRCGSNGRRHFLIGFKFSCLSWFSSVTKHSWITDVTSLFLLWMFCHICFTHTIHKGGSQKSHNPLLQVVRSATDGEPQGALTRTNNTPQQR